MRQLTKMEKQVYECICMESRGLRTVDIERKTGVSQRTISSIVRRLSERGLLRRSYSFDDMRGVWWIPAGGVS